ncbi:MAG: N-acetylmuramoyl-L-alanine amidase [Cytophagales bacterium CG18_big_fil_WC_8_21_14_2_50_42_9]|nr:MAG: N-acetylmuramoyl-L-alanine amidase [Cytophagales bacterium CG18_big_fil_WC_8_21_14_2_50_42_9]
MILQFATRLSFFLFIGWLLSACSTNPYALTNKSYKKQVKSYARTLRAIPFNNPEEDSLMLGDYWVGTTNFNMRKANFVVIHHTAQNSTAQTLKTFTVPKTQVSAHYVIGRDGKVYHMLNDYLRAWHGGVSKWGNNTDLNSSSIGIELDNNGQEPFPEAQINSLLQVLALLKKNHNMPTANFIGHSDIAPLRKTDPNAMFPWKQLAANGYGLWYDEIVPDTIMVQDSSGLALDTIMNYNLPENFNSTEALRIIGYDTKDVGAAIRAFKLHFVQKDITPVLTDEDKRILYSLYKKYL